MSTLTAKKSVPVAARGVRFAGKNLCVDLTDGRALSVPMHEIPWLKWLATATPRQRSNWSLEPGGYAIYWEDLDDGVEVCHLMSHSQLVGG